MKALIAWNLLSCMSWVLTTSALHELQISSRYYIRASDGKKSAKSLKASRLKSSLKFSSKSVKGKKGILRVPTQTTAASSTSKKGSTAVVGPKQKSGMGHVGATTAKSMKLPQINRPPSEKKSGKKYNKRNSSPDTVSATAKPPHEIQQASPRLQEQNGALHDEVDELMKISFEDYYFGPFHVSSTKDTETIEPDSDIDAHQEPEKTTHITHSIWTGTKSKNSPSIGASVGPVTPHIEIGYVEGLIESPTPTTTFGTWAPSQVPTIVFQSHPSFLPTPIGSVIGTPEALSHVLQSDHPSSFGSTIGTQLSEPSPITSRPGNDSRITNRPNILSHTAETPSPSQITSMPSSHSMQSDYPTSFNSMQSDYPTSFNSMQSDYPTIFGLQNKSGKKNKSSKAKAAKGTSGKKSKKSQKTESSAAPTSTTSPSTNRSSKKKGSSKKSGFKSKSRKPPANKGSSKELPLPRASEKNKKIMTQVSVKSRISQKLEKSRGKKSSGKGKRTSGKGNGKGNSGQGTDGSGKVGSGKGKGDSGKGKGVPSKTKSPSSSTKKSPKKSSKKAMSATISPSRTATPSASLPTGAPTVLPFSGPTTSPSPAIVGPPAPFPTAVPMPTTSAPSTGPPSTGPPVLTPSTGPPASGQPVSGPSTGQPSTAPPTTGPPVSAPSTGPPISVPSTGPPSTESPVIAPSTGPPSSGSSAPSTGPPSTGPPISMPTTGPPSTGPPSTGPPIVAPSTGPPSSGVPSSGPPVSPSTGPPSTGSPGPSSTGPPVSAPPTEPPASTIPTTGPPSTGPPSTSPPSTSPPSMTAPPATLAPTSTPLPAPTQYAATGMPTQTFAPSPNTQPTLAPAPINNTVPISPFSITYEISGSNPTAEDFSQAEAVTKAFLEEVTKSVFESSAVTSLDSLSGNSTGTSLNPAKIGYQFEAVFSKSSEFIPTQEELDRIAMIAFQQPTVQTLLLMLQNLPANNPFSTTSSASYSTESTSTLNTGAIVGIACTATLLIGLGAVAGSRRWRLLPSKQYRPAPNDKPMENVVNEIDYDHDQTLSNCESSIGSRSKLYEPYDDIDDVEIQFGPDSDNSDDENMSDPLFQSPFVFSQSDLIR